jgi:hypothetical protein
MHAINSKLLRECTRHSGRVHRACCHTHTAGTASSNQKRLSRSSKIRPEGSRFAKVQRTQTTERQLFLSVSEYHAEIQVTRK